MTISSMKKNSEWRKKPYEAYKRMAKALENNFSEEIREEICLKIFADMIDEFHREQRKK